MEIAEAHNKSNKKKKEILKVKGYISLSDDVFDAVMKKTEIFLK